MDRGIGDASPVQAGLTPVSQDVAPDTAATAGERKGKPTDKGNKEPPPMAAAAAPVMAPDAPASIDLNALHKMSPEELAELGKKFGVFLNPGRTRHYHILDVVRAALGSGSTVTEIGRAHV